MRFIDMDNRINIEKFDVSLKEWLTLEEGYQLPDGYIGRVYEPDIQHYLVKPDGSAEPQPLNWEEGNQYLQRVAYYTQTMTRIRKLNNQTVTTVLNEEYKTLWQK